MNFERGGSLIQGASQLSRSQLLLAFVRMRFNCLVSLEIGVIAIEPRLYLRTSPKSQISIPNSAMCTSVDSPSARKLLGNRLTQLRCEDFVPFLLFCAIGHVKSIPLMKRFSDDSFAP